MKFTKSELDLIWCSLEDSLNSDDFIHVQSRVGQLMDKIEKIIKNSN